MRVACLEVPLFALAARLRGEPELRDQAVAILAGSGDAARVVAATRSARRAGVRSGLTLSQARARMPRLTARARDGECERAAQEALLDVAESFSPRVEDAGEGLAYLDVGGLERLHREALDGIPPEEALGRALVLAGDRHAGLPLRVGLAASKLAARLAAGRNPTPSIVPAGGEAEFLAPLPLARATPQSDVAATLARWGVRSLGELAALPAAEVVSRLGAVGEELQLIARGVDPRPLVPRRPPPVFREGMELEWPLVQAEPFLFVARAALERLVRRMQSHGLGCRRLELDLTLDPDGNDRRSLDLPAPTREVKTLLTLLRLDLERRQPGAPVVAFTLTAHPDRPRAAQMSLFGPAELSPDRLATTLARLFATLGEDRVGAPQEVDGHRPERFALAPYAPPPPPAERRLPPSSRGLLAVRALRPPLAVEVLTDAASPDEAHRSGTARPLSVSLPAGEAAAGRPKIGGRVRLASGPWDLEEGWWTEAPLDREYWDIELAGGGLYRLFRDRGGGDWFVDGIYD